MKRKIKPRATRREINNRLEQLVGSEAGYRIQHIVYLLDGGATIKAIHELKSLDDEIGGYCGMPTTSAKPPGVYRPLGYVPVFLESPHPREMARYMIDAVGQHVENLLQRVCFLGFLNEISERLLPMGGLVRSMKPFLPDPLYEHLQWFASEVYNHAKHSIAVGDPAVTQKADHYFDLDEALAVYLVGRELAVELEAWSGKSREQLMSER